MAVHCYDDSTINIVVAIIIIIITSTLVQCDWAELRLVMLITAGD